jgi:hypothetical protein
MIEVVFKSGRVREYRSDYMVSSGLFGDSALTEVDYRFDDLEEGLFMELSCQRPALEEDAAGRDERGAPCYMERVSYLQILERKDFGDVAEVRRGGKPALVFREGRPVSLGRIQALCTLYLSDTSGAVADMVAALYPVLEHRYSSGVAAGTIKAAAVKDAWIASELGITEDMLSEYREITEAKAIASGEYGGDDAGEGGWPDGADVFDGQLAT